MSCYAVIDTNVLVSALLSSSVDAATVQVVTRMVAGEIIPVYRSTIMSEYRDVLLREKFGFSMDAVSYPRCLAIWADRMTVIVPALKTACEAMLTETMTK